MSKLTAKQSQFCQEYLIDLNATQAAIRAGYSTKTADKIGHENQKKPEIQARIEELRQSQQQRTQVNADLVVEKFWKIANFDIRSVCTFDGSNWQFKPFSEWDESAFSVISITGVTKDGKPQIKSESKLAALDSLSKHLGLYSDFNIAIATLKTYGLNIRRDGDNWFLDNNLGSSD
jgi:phage terminase small subunit